MAEIDDHTILDVSVDADVDPPVIRAVGELDGATADVLRAAVGGLVEAAPGLVVLDLADVEFMDSSGLAVLLEATQRLPQVRLRQPSRAVQRVIEVTGVDQVLRSE